MKKYLDDKAIDRASDDKFGHLNLAKQIAEIISEQTADHPVNIGLFGKWGVGKSSVVELLEKNVLTEKIANNEIRFIRVNVWKYHSVTSIRNKIFYQIGKTLDVEDNVKKLYENSTTTSSNIDYQDFFENFFEGRFSKDRFENFAITGIVFAVFLTMLYCIYKVSPQAGFVANSVFTIIASGTFIKFAMDYFMKTFVSSTAVVSKPFESEEQFEHAVIDLFNNQDFKEMKKILFIDDLDRCSSDKVLLTLETIKTFLQISNCVFIVACDQDMVKKAVIDSNKDFKYSDKDGANYLEKFFQHFIYLPPYLPTNLRNYTKNIITESDLSILTSLSNKQLDTVIYILAYKDIINPRKIKVLLNSFIFDYYSIMEKEGDETHLLQPGFITHHPERLAILTVLKIDFPLFVNDLIIDPTLASKIAYQDQDVDQDKFKSKYFTAIASENKDYHDQLDAYLSLVKDWIPRDFTPYLFVSLETTGFNELPSIDHIRFVQLIRDGDTGLMAALEKLSEAERLKACAAIGTLQESLTNTIERKNATAAFTHVAEAYPDLEKYINAPEVLYSFKSNYENGFVKDLAALGINDRGLANLITYAFNRGYDGQGRSLLRMTQERLSSPPGYLFFLLPFLNKKHYVNIQSDLLKEILKELLEREIPIAVNDLTYTSIIPDIMGIQAENNVFVENCGALATAMAKISAHQYSQLKGTAKGTYEIEFDERIFTRMVDLGMDQLVVDFLEKLTKRHIELFRYYIAALPKLFVRSRTVYEYIFSLEAVEAYEESDEGYLIALLTIAQQRMVSYHPETGRTFNQNVLSVFTEANTFIASFDSEKINALMISCYENVLHVVDISREDKARFIAVMVLKTPLLTRNEANLVMLLKRAYMSFRTQAIFDATTSKLIAAIAIVKDKGIGTFESFFKSYHPLVDCNSLSFDKNVISEIFALNKGEGAPTTAGILKKMIANLKKPVDLRYILIAMDREANIEYIRFCSEILVVNTKVSKSTSRLLSDVLTKIILKTTPTTADKKSTWIYPHAVRAAMIEALLLHSEYNFNSDLSKYLDLTGMNAGLLRNARLVTVQKIVSENQSDGKTIGQVATAFNHICRATSGVPGQQLELFADYLGYMVSRIVASDGPRKKSELQNAFLTVQENFKHYSFPVEKAVKTKLSLALEIALKSNPNLAGRVSKIKKIFKL